MKKSSDLNPKERIFKLHRKHVFRHAELSLIEFVLKGYTVVKVLVDIVTLVLVGLSFDLKMVASK